MAQPAIEFDEAFLLAMEQQRQSASSRTKLERYLELLRPRPGERILDLGCGSGAHCRALAELVAPGGHVVGVDAAPAAIAVAGRLSVEVDSGLLSFQVADGHQLPFADAAFDAAVCISVLAFCADPRRVLAELRRVTRPGGRLLVASSDEDSRLYNHDDRALGRRVLRAIADRARDPWLGRRLASLLRAAELRVVQEEVVADSERRFAPGYAGYALAHAVRDYLLGSGELAAGEYDRWLAGLRTCDRDGTYCYGVTTYAYLATR